MKKILFLGRFSPPMHGAARMNGLYYDALREKYDVRKIKINFSSSIGEVGRFNLFKFLGVFVVFFQTLFQLLLFWPDLVYFEIAPNGFAFYRDSIYVILCKLFRRRIVFSNHARGVGEEMNGGFKEGYYRFVFRNSRIILLSKLFYLEFKELYEKKDVYFLGNGVEDEISDKKAERIFKERKKNKVLQLLFLSNMIESKGPADVLQLCSRLKKNRIKFECNFVGAFSDENFEKRWFAELKKRRLEKECKYLGAVYGDNKEMIWASANYLVFPTVYPMECYPLVILEAFMHGVPVLSYDTAAVREIISKDFLGYVSKKKNTDELYGHLKNNLGVKDWVRIREYFKRNYTIEIAGKKLNRIIEKII